MQKSLNISEERQSSNQSLDQDIKLLLSKYPKQDVIKALLNKGNYSPSYLLSLVMSLGGRDKERISQRNTLFPIIDEQAYTYAKIQEACIWNNNEMGFNDDYNDYKFNITNEERNMLDLILAFFSASDGQVIDNIAFNFLPVMMDSDNLEEIMFYIFQLTIEVVHSETYSLMINTFKIDPEERRKLFEAADEIDCIKARNYWIRELILSDLSRAERVFSFACFEGINFMSSFLGIFYFRKSGKLKELVFANEQILKDETLHCLFAILRYKKLGKLSDERAHYIVNTCVKYELAFINYLIPETGFPGLSRDEAGAYVQHISNFLLEACSHPTLYAVDKDMIPAWMNDIAMSQKHNFYEVKVGNYTQSSLEKALNWKSRITGDGITFSEVCENPLMYTDL